MSLLGTVVTAVFATNAVFVYGLELPLGGKSAAGAEAPGRASLAAIALILVDIAASLFLWFLRSVAFAPLGLEAMDALVYVLIAVPAVKSAAKLAERAKYRWLAVIGSEGDELALGSLSFGIALLATRPGFGLAEAITASAGSGAGYWLAKGLLGSLEARLELSDLPRPFRGNAAMLLSAGLMSMAFMGIDEVLVKNLTG